MGSWKGIRFGTKAPLALYDLKTDRGEKNNVASKHPDMVRKMETFLAMSRIESKYFPAKEKATKKKKPRKKKLGYPSPEPRLQ